MVPRSGVVGAVALAFGAGWVARRPTTVVPEVVFRWVRLGPGATVELPVERADPVTEACASDHRVAIALLGLPDDVPLAAPATEAGCRARIELATAVATAAQLEKAGRPSPFSPDLPEQYRRAAVEAVAQDVVRTCPELGLSLSRMDCAEYPCMVLFVGPPKASPTQCPAWTDAYGAGNMDSNGVLVGPDGQRIGYDLIGPLPPEGTPGVPAPDPQPDEPFALSPMMRRLGTRGETARDEVMAATGARELTTAEERADQRARWARRAEHGDEDAARMLEMLEQVWAEEDRTAAPR